MSSRILFCLGLLLASGCDSPSEIERRKEDAEIIDQARRGRRGGDVKLQWNYEGGRQVTRLEAKLLERRKVTEKGCWECTEDGQMRLDGERVRVAPAAYAIWVGAVPKGKKVGRSCGNEKCYNPAHLFVGTTAEILIAARKRPRRDGWHWGRKKNVPLEERDYVEACRARYKYRGYIRNENGR